MLKKITNNLGWKIVSLVIAFFLWLAVVNSEDPMISRKFDDVLVNKVNEEVITSQRQPTATTETTIETYRENIVGKYIEYKSGETVDIIVKGNRSVIDKMTVDDIFVYADMENLSITNAIDIEVELDDSIGVVSINPANMIIELEDVISVQKEVQYYFEGEPMAKFIALEPEIAPTVIQVTGPESKVSLISSVVVPIKITDATKDVTLLASPQILDSSKEEINALSANVEEVAILVPIEKIKTIPIKYIAIDGISEGYKLMSYNFDFNTVTVRGDEEKIDDITEISIDTITLGDMTEDTTVNIPLEAYLPDGISIYNDVTEVNVAFDIEPLIEKEISISVADLTVKNLSEGMQFSFVDNEPIVITIEGVNSAVNAVDVQDINPYISVSELEEGTHEVKVSYHIPSSVTEISEEKTVTVLLEKEIAVEDQTSEIGTTEAGITTNNND